MRSITVIKTILLSLLGGALLWFWLFALVFTRSYADYWASAILPFSVLAVGAGVLGFVAARNWYLAAITIPLPLTVMNLAFFAMVYVEGRGAAWSYIWSVAVAVWIAWLASMVGFLARSGRRQVPPTVGE